MPKDSEKSVNLEIDRQLWLSVGVYSAANDTTKKKIVEMALRQFLSNNRPKHQKN